MSKTLKLTFTREDLETIILATKDKNINGLMAASDSPVLVMFEWLNKNHPFETYDKAGNITIAVPERMAVDYLGSLLLMGKIAPKWNFRRMAFRACGVMALFVECSMMDVLSKMDEMNEGDNEAHRWN